MFLKKESRDINDCGNCFKESIRCRPGFSIIIRKRKKLVFFTKLLKKTSALEDDL